MQCVVGPSVFECVAVRSPERKSTRSEGSRKSTVTRSKKKAVYVASLRDGPWSSQSQLVPSLQLV